MLPKHIENWHPNTQRPTDRNRIDIKKYIAALVQQGMPKEALESLIITKDEAKNVLDEMGVKKNTPFYEFYANFISTDSSEKEYADPIFDLDEIYDNYKNSFWAEEYPGITDRYLQLSSIEGEGSYFYDKKTDAVYDVDWSEMDDFMAGKLEPRWKSFYDFLEWYYGEDE